MRTVLTVVMPGLMTASALAGDMDVSIEIPRLNVAEYHRPYVAAWIEDKNRKHVANLAIWYDIDLPKKEGETWLKDLRQWWRKSGRSLKLPVDGVSGPTQPVGEHTVSLPMGSGPVANLTEGEYTLVVEAAREVGGREMVHIPFTWPLEAGTLEAAGTSELATIKLTIKP